MSEWHMQLNLIDGNQRHLVPVLQFFMTIAIYKPIPRLNPESEILVEGESCYHDNTVC